MVQWSATNDLLSTEGSVQRQRYRIFNYFCKSDFLQFYFYLQFRNGIEPETDYEVRVWSINNIGSSDIVKLPVKTPKIFEFVVSSVTISPDGCQAIVKFSATEDKLPRLYVTCCLELTGSCNNYNYYIVSSTAGQVTCDNIPPGVVYVFDFMVYGGLNPRGNTYYLAMEKGVRVSRNGEADGEFHAIMFHAINCAVQ